MAIGQLYDYRRFHQPIPTHLAVLLPYKPATERLNLLQSVDVEELWPHAQGFRDSVRSNHLGLTLQVIAAFARSTSLPSLASHT